ncbi:hypothetical protein WDU99_12835 [Microbacterium sp. Mu-80]|uniref:Uncharacterized protein n=1 Tax=Microbacterium bandirmense TaxID=3122050 RepID=A0ABU8LDX9_9MICO
MYSIAPAEAPTSTEIWAAFAALRLLHDAEDRLAAAEAVVTGMVADAAWHNEGLAARSLRDALGRLHDAIRAEIVSVQEQQGVARAAVR